MTDIRNIDGDVIFTSANENDTIKQAVEQAVKADVSLRKADLMEADLRSVDLVSADPQAKFSSAHFYKLLNILELESANFRAAVLESKTEQNND